MKESTSDNKITKRFRRSYRSQKEQMRMSDIQIYV